MGLARQSASALASRNEFAEAADSWDLSVSSCVRSHARRF
jgi:hypothetical protein